MRRRSRFRAATSALALLALVSGCGTRVPHDDVVAAAGSSATTDVAGLADPVAGGTDDASASELPDSSGEAGAAGGGDDPASAAAGGGASPGQPTAAPDSEPAAGTPVRIGVVGSLSGPAGASLKPIADGVRIWAKAVNDRGGVNGHPVDVVVGDDGGDPARHRSLIQEFVEQKKVIAFVGNPEALTGEGSVAYLTQKGVPVIGSEAAGQYFYESPVYFPQGSHGKALAQSGALTVSEVAKERGGLTKVATITCLEVQVCRDSHESAPRLYAKFGMQVVYRAQASIGQPDFTAECLNAQNAGAQVVTIGMDANAIRAIAQACARQGYRPLFSWTAGSAIAAHAEDPNLDGALVATIVAPWASDNTPGRKEFLDAMGRYAKGVDPSGGHMMGWVSGKVFELGAKELPEPPTSKALLDGLGRINGDVLPDLTGPLLFSPGKPARPTVCGFGVTIDGGRFTAALGGRRSCADFDPSI